LVFREWEMGERIKLTLGVGSTLRSQVKLLGREKEVTANHYKSACPKTVSTARLQVADFRQRQIASHDCPKADVFGQTRRQQYFADGMTEALITELSKIGSLEVISRTSVMRFKGTTKPLPMIARELDVDGIVEGSVLRSGKRVRITAQLVRASSDTHLWAQSYEGDLGDVLILQGKVAQAIADEIRAKVTPQERSHLANTRPVNPEAYEFYLKGRYEWNKRTEDGLRRGIEFFQQAINLAPAYALPYAGMSDCYTALASNSHVAGRVPREEVGEDPLCGSEMSVVIKGDHNQNLPSVPKNLPSARVHCTANVSVARP